MPRSLKVKDMQWMLISRETFSRGEVVIIKCMHVHVNAMTKPWQRLLKKLGELDSKLLPHS